MVNERKIDYLLKIAETQSITRAAKELYVSQSALSQLIASLEKTYDTKIFEYKGGHLTPTYTGEMILNTFRQQQLLEGRLNRQLEDVRQSQHRTVIYWDFQRKGSYVPFYYSSRIPERISKHPADY